jgi:uncharacterized protein with PhoU and TrkA domain
VGDKKLSQYFVYKKDGSSCIRGGDSLILHGDEAIIFNCQDAINLETVTEAEQFFGELGVTHG